MVDNSRAKKLMYFSFLFLQPGLIKYQISQLAWTILILALVVAQTKSCFYSIYNGLIWFLLPASLVVCNDR
jgi:phosphatidate cytidylyltransferase